MQTTKLTTKPTHEVISAIQALDLESVKIRLMDEELGEGWTQAYADSIEHAYRNYLVMLAKYPDHAEEIMLSKDVDEFWHTHILQTVKYTEDCERVFGAYLHHNPHVGARTRADLDKRVAQTEKTRRLYEREFGSAHGAEAAWAGATIRSDQAAYSNAAIRERQAAYSNAAIKAEQAAYSNAAIKAERAAYSNAAISAKHAAYSNAAIKPERAAYSNAAISAEQAAYSNAAIKPERAAYSNAAIRAENAAYSNAALNASR